MDWERIIKEMETKGLITLGSRTKSVSPIISTLRRASLKTLLSSQNYCVRDPIDWLDFFKGNKN
jgi:hypothetical protein